LNSAVSNVSPAAPHGLLTLKGLAGGREGGAPVRERLTSMLFLAAIAHAIVILGISFGVASRHTNAPPGMEVLLVTDDLPEARSNERAAYLAQRTQRGAGNTHVLPTGSPAERAAAKAAIAAGRGDAEEALRTGATASDEPMLTTGAPAPTVRWLGSRDDGLAARSREAQESPEGDPRHGRGDARELVLRGDPKTGQWLSPDTKASRLAPYLDAWRRKVERVGTLNFPSAARRAELSGSPVIEVAIAADGHLLEAAIQRPSGHATLDQAALQILKLASPFEPFPKALARDYASLRFAYQWEFAAGQLGAGAVTADTNDGTAP
jgi:periplasmic protein TonB